MNPEITTIFKQIPDRDHWCQDALRRRRYAFFGTRQHCLLDAMLEAGVSKTTELAIGQAVLDLYPNRAGGSRNVDDMIPIFNDNKDTDYRSVQRVLQRADEILNQPPLPPIPTRERRKLIRL